MLRVLAPGLRSTVQDGGRFGHLRAAVPPAGPADPLEFATANVLVGNPPDAAAIEVVGSPFRFVCDDARIIAVTGRWAQVRSRDRLPVRTALFVRGGQQVEVIGDQHTRYAYVAVSGGIALEPKLGSVATYVPAALGPTPRAFRDGDALALGASRIGAERASIVAGAVSYERPIRAMRGPHQDRFEAGEVDRFFATTFRASEESDRMGLRLRVVGEPLRRSPGELLTCGMVAGAVQLPSGDEAIVLLADHQTTGGYPVIATVIGADLGRAAQSAPGEQIRFQEVDRDEALEALREERRRLDSMR